MPPRHGSVISPLPKVDRRELVARLERERRSVVGRCAIALDADGTLWSGDVGYDLFKAALAERALRPAARSALAEEARGAGLSASGSEDANELALRLFASWATGGYDDDRAFRMMAWAFAGHEPEGLLRLAERALEAADLRGRVHAEVRETITWAHEAGVEVWIVSASPRAAVEVGVRQLGVEPDRVLAVTPIVSAGVLSTELEEPVPFDRGKPLAFAAAAPEVSLLAAFGDSSFDEHLLRAARVAVAVEPHDRLRALVLALPHLVELQLEPTEAGA